MLTLGSCILGLQLLLIHLVVADVFTVRKCCPKGETLLDISKLKCTTLPPIHSSNNQGYDWIPNPLEDSEGEDANLTIANVKVEYGLGPKCDIENRKFTKTLYYKKDEPTFRLFANNGSLVEIKNFINDTWRVGFFTETSFCVDNVRNEEYTHAAKICMCAEKKCIQKCCSYGKYLNTDKNICLPAKQTLPNYTPTIYDNNLLPMLDPPSDLYFLEALPRCKPRGFDVLNGVDETALAAFYILSTGNVVLIDDTSNRTVDPMGYCFDMIQIDEETIGPNLAVCQDTRNSSTRKDDIQRSMELFEEDTSSRGTNPLCHLPMVAGLSLCTRFQLSFISG